jgi:acetyl-CoA carboxylase biotin carboxyl carrier protein
MPKNTRPPGSTGRPWELNNIQKLIDLIIEREIDEFEMESNGLRIRIKRGSSAASASAQVAPSLVSLPAAIVQAAAAPTTTPVAGQTETRAAPVAETPTEEVSEELHIVKSPMVGTFYNAPAPNAAPFVKPGDVVKVGQVLCIIEAMKLMNEIESDIAGEVVRGYMENGQPVEYGQSLFAIKPSHKK